MTKPVQEPPLGDPNASLPGDTGWTGPWGFLFVLFASLLVACGSWVAGTGWDGAIEDGRFQALTTVTLVVGIIVGYRNALRVFGGGTSVDSRNVQLMKSLRGLRRNRVIGD